ncbi:beta strand repeat-containing protein, partial [Caballeronia calidae]|uniref:beta strand repeat-containing protein n=1 Tax=Caballeronia calidae TaxID=1777139 RepID=UPI001E4462EB
MTVYGNDVSAGSAVGVSIGSIVSGGGAVNLTGLVNASNGSAGVSLGSVYTGGGALSVSAVVGGSASSSASALVLASLATLSSAGGAITLNASNTDVNNGSAGGDAVSFLNGGLIDSAGGNLLANWFTASGGVIAGAATGTAVVLRSGSGALNLNLAGALGYALVFPTRVQLGGSAQSGNISVHADVGNLALSGVSAQTAGALTVQSGSGLASLAGMTVGLNNLQGLTTSGVFSAVTLGDANTTNITGISSIAASGAVAATASSQILLGAVTGSSVSVSAGALVSLSSISTSGGNVSITAGTTLSGGAISVGSIATNGGSIVLSNQGPTSQAGYGVQVGVLNTSLASGTGGAVTVYGNDVSAGSAVGVSIGSIVSGGGAVNLTGLVSGASGHAGVSLGSVYTGGGALSVSAVVGGSASTSASALVLASLATLSSAGGAI